MATESPLFQSSMELLGHSITHFIGSKELDKKLVILHLANSIELILKDIILDSGESIYKNPKETITVLGAIQKLKELSISIPYINKIELLIDERNALQHRFGSPNELTTIFYMNIASDFFKEILLKHYSLDFDEVLSQFSEEKDLLAFKLREPANESELENLLKLSDVHPLGALLSATTYLERRIVEFAEKVGLKEQIRRYPISGFMSHRFLDRYGILIPDELRSDLDDARKIRNLAAHGRKDPTRDDAQRIIRAIEKYEDYLSSLDIEEIQKLVTDKLQEIEAERNSRRE